MIPTIGAPLILQRLTIRDDGAFGCLQDDDTGPWEALTCERTYGDPGVPTIVLPAGSYRCQRGIHSLDGVNKFETFEVMDVPGHTGILFHWANWETDSRGCIGVGNEMGKLSGRPAILHSMAAFDAFMAKRAGIDRKSVV